MNDSRLREAASEAVASWLEWLHTKDAHLPTPRWLGAMEKLEAALAEPTSDLRAKLEALRDEMGGMVMDARSSVDVHKTIAAPYSFVKKLDDIHKRLTAILDGRG